MNGDRNPSTVSAGMRKKSVAEEPVTSVLAPGEVPVFDRELTADEEVLAALGYKYGHYGCVARLRALMYRQARVQARVFTMDNFLCLFCRAGIASILRIHSLLRHGVHWHTRYGLGLVDRNGFHSVHCHGHGQVYHHFRHVMDYANPNQLNYVPLCPLLVVCIMRLQY